MTVEAPSNRYNPSLLLAMVFPVAVTWATSPAMAVENRPNR